MHQDRIRSYRDLKVWQRAVDLTVQVYKITSGFPDEEKYGLVSQLRRAAVSVSSNIAEGWARGTTSEYLNFLRYARGSLAEIETQVITARQLGLLSESHEAGLLEAAEIEGRMLLSLTRSLENRLDNR